jgi:hypothetical protein
MAGALTEADVAYIRAGYFTLAELCAGRADTPAAVEPLIAAGVLPAPSYVLEDGTGMFPADYFVFVDQAGGPERLHGAFEARYAAAGGQADDTEDDWRGYLEGSFGVCLRHVTPESIVRKGQLVGSLTALLAEPDAESSAWQARLRREIWELEAMERAFSPDFDRNGRFAQPPSRDRLIGAAHERYPALFGRPV